MNPLRAAVPVSAIAMLLVLTGCAAAEPAPTASPTASESPQPTPSATPAAHTVPEPKLGVDCAALVAPELLESALSDSVDATGEPFADLAAGAGPLAYALPQLGGLNCYWTNDQQEQDGTGAQNPAYAALSVLVLPDVTDADLNGLGESEECADLGGSFRCAFSSVVGTSWVNASASGVRGDDPAATIAPVFDAIRTAIAAATVRDSGWQPPADTIPLPDECNAILDRFALTEIFGTSTPIVAGRSGGGWSLEAASWQRLNAFPCQLLFENADIGVGFVNWLPGGDWAFPSDDPDAEEVELAGLVDDDQVRVNCGATLSGQSCTADVAVGHNWIRVTTHEAESEGQYGYSITPRDSAIAVAELIVDGLRS